MVSPIAFVELPVEAGRYYGLAATDKTLFYISFPIRVWPSSAPRCERRTAPKATLMAFDLEKREAKPFVEGISGYDPPGQGRRKIAIMKERGEIFVLDAGAPPGR